MKRNISDFLDTKLINDSEWEEYQKLKKENENQKYLLLEQGKELKEIYAENEELQQRIDKANAILAEPDFEYDNIPCNYENKIKELKEVLKGGE